MNTNVISFNPSDMIQTDEYYGSIATLVNSARQQLEDVLQKKSVARSDFERDQLERKIALLASAPVTHVMKSLSQTKNIYEARIAQMRTSGATEDDIKAVRDECMKKRINNIFEIMYLSECRGSPKNATQMAMILGAQYVGSNRTDASKMPLLYNRHAQRNPDGSEKQTAIGNGIIDSSFMNGLTPEQYAIHSAPVRYSVVVGKTEIANTGYRSMQMSTIHGQYVVESDLSLTGGNMLVTKCVGAFMNPETLLSKSYKGHGVALFVDPTILVNSVNYMLDKSGL
jgi:hypothetical protein